MNTTAPMAQAPSAATPDMLKSALAYANLLHWSVFPCNGKIPAISKEQGGHGCKDATVDQTKITEWWGGPYRTANIGVAAGDFWVLDVDGEDGARSLAELEAEFGPLPQTVTQITGSGGRHYLFRRPEGITIRNRASQLGNRKARGLDTRSDGGFIVVAPSVHPETGQRYRWAENARPDQVQIADAPDWLIDLVKEKPRPQPGVNTYRPPDGSADAYAEAALDGEILRVMKAGEPGRNDALNAAAFSLGQLIGAGVLDESRVRTALWNAATSCGLVSDPRDGPQRTKSTIESGLQAGIKQPRQIQEKPQNPPSNKGRHNPAISTEWGEFSPLVSTPSEPEPYPLNVLPSVLLEAAHEVARFVMVPVESPAVIGISVAAIAIGKKVLIEERPGLLHRPSLFQVVVQPSGERKSPIPRLMGKPLDEWEEERKPIWEEDCRNIKAANAISEKIAIALEKEASADLLDVDREVLKTKIANERANIKPEPPLPRLYTSDASEQRLFQMMHDRDGVFAVVSSEGRPVIDAILGRYAGDGYTGDGIYLAGVSGDTVTRDRVSSAERGGPEGRKIAHPMLNVGIMVQPDKYMEAARHERLRAAGTLARIWPVFPPSMVGKRTESEDDTGLDIGKLEPYYALIRKILNTEQPTEDGVAISHRITLGPDATKARRAWHNVIEAMMAEDGELEDVRDIACKAVSNTVKLAGILHVLQHSDYLPTAGSEISLATWKAAQTIGEYHLAEAIRVQRMAAEDSKLIRAEKVAHWLIRQGKAEFIASDITKDGPRPRPTVEELKETILPTLADHGWIRLKEAEPGERTERYEIRPDLR